MPLQAGLTILLQGCGGPPQMLYVSTDWLSRLNASSGGGIRICLLGFTSIEKSRILH